MKQLITKRIGSTEYVFQVEGENFHHVIMAGQKLSFGDVRKCGLCESDYLSLRAYKTKDGQYEYTKVSCNKCNGSLTFGQRKDDKDTFFLRRTPDGQYDWKAVEKPTDGVDLAKKTFPDSKEVPF